MDTGDQHSQGDLFKKKIENLMIFFRSKISKHQERDVCKIVTVGEIEETRDVTGDFQDTP